MKQSINKPLPFFKGKYYNTQVGEKQNHFVFYLPSIVKSPKVFLNWDIMMFSIFIGIGRKFIQFNIFENIKNTSTNFSRPDLDKLLNILRSENLDIILDKNHESNLRDLTLFLEKNSYILVLLKNAKEDHPYIRTIIASYFKDQSFITYKK